MLIEFTIYLVKAALLAALAASITALCTAPGPGGLKYGGRLKAAYPAWIAASLGLCLCYFYVFTQGQPPSSVPGILIFALGGFGGWGALLSVRARRLRSTSQETSTEALD